MRPQQQNRRMRGRNNNTNNNNHNNNSNNNQNRRGPNPLTRNYESNGPDLKIRGSAMQIAEKYMTLARDAHSSGDRVMSENYYQHAEHYNRIIAAAQAQLPVHQTQPRNDDFDEDMDDGFDPSRASQPVMTPASNGQASPSTAAPVDRSFAPQPTLVELPAEISLPAQPAAAPSAEEEAANGRRLNGFNGTPPEGAPADGPNDAPRRARRPRRPRRDLNAAPGAMGESGDPVDRDPAPSSSGEAADGNRSDSTSD